MNRTTSSYQALPELLTATDVADYLGVPVSTIHFWRGRGQGPAAIKVGRRLVFRAEDLAEWIQEQAAPRKVDRSER
jgi:excisionase family DNA binding protein